MATPAQIKACIETLAPIAIAQAKKHNNALFPSITIATGCNESGYGTSQKMVAANALYGIKVGKSAYKFGEAWGGEAYSTKTKEYYNSSTSPTVITDMFRAYDSIDKSTEDYMDMLCKCKRYKNALNRKTPRESIEAIIAGGYATGPEYVNHIMRIVDKYNLTRFDSATMEGYIIGKTYTLASNLYIRERPAGIKMKFDAITDNARKSAHFDVEGNAILNKDTRVTCLEQKQIGEDTWIKIPSGWICGKLGQKVFVI